MQHQSILKKTVAIPFLLSYSISSYAVEKMSLGIGLVAPSLKIELDSSRDADSESLSFRPNSGNYTSIIGQYGHIGFSLKSPSNREGDENVPLRSSASDYQIRFFGKRSTYEISYQTYKGYYIENFSDYSSSLNKTSEAILFPDLKTSNYSANYIYNMHPEKFNLDAAFGYSSMQESSGGSLLIGLFFSRQTINSDKPLAPSFSGAKFNEFSDFIGLSQYNLGVSGGYGYYYTKFNYFLSVLGMASVAYQNQELFFNSSSKKQGLPSYKIAVNLSFGYNSEKYRIAINTLSSDIRTNIGSGALHSSPVDVGVMYIYRWSDVSVPYLEPLSNWISRSFDSH